MDARKLVFDMSGHPLLQMAEKVKQARAHMMLAGSSKAYIYFHREIELEHDDSQFCICDPVVITQTDYRPSLYFAEQILYPVVH